MPADAHSQDSGVAALDLGKTKTAVAVFVRGARIDLPSVGGAPGLSAPGGPAAAVAATDAALAQYAHLLAESAQSPAESAQSPADVSPSVVVVGAAGALAAPGAAAGLAASLTGRADVHRSAVTSDAITAHLGALGGRCGVVLIAGTGAVAVAVTADGQVRLVDGAGPEAGDRGSGGWIGRAALQLAASGSAGPGLLAAIETTVGPSWPTLADRTDAAAAAERGRLVPALLNLWRAGDPQAAGLFDRAASELAATVRQADLQPVTVVGGLTALGPAFLDLVRARSGVDEWVEPVGDALDGAALLADHTDLPHETLVHRSNR